jgi:hypothetical protein
MNVSRPLIYKMARKDSATSNQWIYREDRQEAVRLGMETAQRDPATKSSPKITSVPKKVTWIRTPLTVPETNSFLKSMFTPAPILSDRFAYYCLCVTPLLLTAVLGVALPLILWGK